MEYSQWKCVPKSPKRRGKKRNCQNMYVWMKGEKSRYSTEKKKRKKKMIHLFLAVERFFYTEEKICKLGLFFPIDSSESHQIYIYLCQEMFSSMSRNSFIRKYVSIGVKNNTKMPIYFSKSHRQNQQIKSASLLLSACHVRKYRQN